MSPVVVAMDATYPPDEFVAANGQIVGMDVDLINAIGQVLVEAQARERGIRDHPHRHGCREVRDRHVVVH